MSGRTMNTLCPECGRTAMITLDEVTDGAGRVDRRYTLGCPAWHNSSPGALKSLWEDVDHSDPPR
jgi:hypothetical protein